MGIISPPSHKNPSKLLQPPLKWAGGKRWLVPFFQNHLSGTSCQRLVEPFCGGLAVALGLNPEQALLNDVNPHVINFYTHLQKGLVTKKNFKNDETDYYATRERFNALIASGKHLTKEAALCFYYLNKTGYNGLCRFNQSGLFNVPFGQYKTINYVKDFKQYQETLSRWRFTWGDFERVCCTKDDLLYADPPYDVAFVSYAQNGFSWNDQVRLVHWLVKQPCPVIASNQATPRILALYEEHGFSIQLLDAPRRISCTGDRTPAKEMLAFREINL
jgi:DNA adenine methylase